MELRIPALAALLLAANSAMAAVTFYDGENFGGRRTALSGSVPNLVAQGYRDQAGSAVVEGNPVEVCVDINYGGRCTVLQPGRYPQLKATGDRISSVRPAAGRAAATPPVLVAPGGSGGPGGVSAVEVVPPPPAGRRPSATLYSGPNFRGTAIALDREGAGDLQDFNERASSLVVDRGYWIFCSDTGFRGQCRTFGPGKYASLPPALDNRISSGRRISRDYPYTQAPRWEGNR